MSRTGKKMRIAKFPPSYQVTLRQRAVLQMVHRYWASLLGHRFELAVCDVMPYCRARRRSVKGEEIYLSMKPFNELAMLSLSSSISVEAAAKALAETWSYLVPLVAAPQSGNVEFLEPLSPCLFVSLQSEKETVELYLPVSFIEAVSPQMDTAPLDLLTRADLAKARLVQSAVKFQKVPVRLDASLGTCTAKLNELKPGIVLKMDRRRGHD